ncbi:VWA domain-containing protein [Fibrobacter sp. UWB11]|uniref:vWA domain-containing protein n=1 Tax=Fibrobacter sp. UWB11 TaxID=1896202 RepID=UPI0009258EFE|nr:VWA domain-containing protein [Fibrobacter sp. UWB11]SIO32751.1 von Willebrand factor type A domain-containing protein [Fibrobacter sp. UWB11]
MKNMKYKLFALIAVIAVTGTLLCVFFCGGSDHEKTTDNKATSVDESDDGRVEVATVYTVKDDGPRLERAEEHGSKGMPKAAPVDRGVLKLMASRPVSGEAKFAKDIDKVMKSVSGLSTSGKTVLGGRRGSGGFNEGYVAAGSGGIGDGLAGLLGGSASGIKTSKAKTGRSLKSYDMSVSRDEPSSRKSKVRVSERHERVVERDDEPTYRRRRSGRNESRRAGLLTAGEWNDLDNWKFWTNLLDDDDFSGKTDYWDFFPKNLVVVKVVDGNRVGIANVDVELFNSNAIEFTTKTDNAGYAYCWINLFKDSSKKLKAKDYSLKVDGDWVKESIKLTTMDDKKLNVNVVVDDEIRHPKAKADVAFIVDATGSMSDEIKFLKSDLSYIIDHASSESKVALRTAALFYRDEGDAYLTRASDFTDDASETQDFVSEQSASGGGDYPEAVHSALEASLQDLSWNRSARARIAFLILDAPAHHETGVIESLQESIMLYAKHGIKLIPVAASGVDKDTEFMLRFFDVATGGSYVFLTDDSGIGNSHIKASVGNYNVESLTDIMIRLIKKYVK